MFYKISLPGINAFSGEHMGLIFTQGEAQTEDAFLASRLKSKGYTVAADEGVGGEEVSGQGEAPEAGSGGFTPFGFESMTVAQLKNYAEAGGIDLGTAKTKAEIIAAISAEHSG